MNCTPKFGLLAVIRIVDSARSGRARLGGCLTGDYPRAFLCGRRRAASAHLIAEVVSSPDAHQNANRYRERPCNTKALAENARWAVFNLDPRPSQTFSGLLAGLELDLSILKTRLDFHTMPLRY
jgi:hypothetical protein